MIGGLLADTRGADSVVNTVVEKVPERMLPWAMGGVAALLGLPLFFEVGVVLLLPVVLLVAFRSRIPLLLIGIPAVAGPLRPPRPRAAAPGPAGRDRRLEGGHRRDAGARHPGRDPDGDHRRARCSRSSSRATCTSRCRPPSCPPSTATRPWPPPAPAGAAAAAGWTTTPATSAAPRSAAASRATRTTTTTSIAPRTGRAPGFAATVATVLLPVVLMLVRALAELLLTEGTRLRTILEDRRRADRRAAGGRAVRHGRARHPGRVRPLADLRVRRRRAARRSPGSCSSWPPAAASSRR